LFSLAIRELRLAADLGAGDRPACARIAVGRSAALQCVRGACRRPLVLVPQLLFSQVPKFSFSTFGPTGLLPKLIRSRVDFLFAGFSHDVFSELSTAPFRRVGDLPAGTRQTSLETGLSDSSPHEAVSSSPRPPHKTKARRAYTAWPWPGLSRSARIPSPVTEPRTGRNVPADAGAARRVTRSLSAGAHRRDLPTTTSQDCIGGTLGLLPNRTDCELICFARKRNLDAQLRQNNTTGKSPESCPAPFAKIFRFRSHPNHRHNSARLTADEGRSRSSRTCSEMRWTQMAR
jgi:hypothetical protein